MTVSVGTRANIVFTEVLVLVVTVVQQALHARQRSGLHLHVILTYLFFKPLGNKKAEFWIRIHLTRIRIQHFRLNTDPDPVPIRDPEF
jgi:hypothetical protein